MPARTIGARYRMPFLAHATAEPPSATIAVTNDKVVLVAGLHDPAGASHLLHTVTGVPREAIEIRLPRAGGDLGRRLHNDFVVEAALVAKEAGKPVKLVWLREDDLRHDFYRPFGVHDLTATLDRKKRLTGWSHRAAGAGQVTSWLGSPYHGLVPAGTYGLGSRHSRGVAARLPGTSTHGRLRAPRTALAGVSCGILQ